MRILVDTNVVLDALLDRKPFSAEASRLLLHAEAGDLRIVLAATTMTTLFYFARKKLGSAPATRELRELLALVDVVAVGRPVLERAMSLPIADFEDAVIAAAAEACGAEALVTRDVRGFAESAVPVHTPREWLALISPDGKGRR